MKRPSAPGAWASASAEAGTLTKSATVATSIRPFARRRIMASPSQPPASMPSAPTEPATTAEMKPAAWRLVW